MVTLEAWALGRPVLANARCDVLCGQCVRSNAGLYYENYEEFAATLETLRLDATLRQQLGRNGERYFKTHYSWPVIESKYLDMLERLDRQDMEDVPKPPSLPGWIRRRQRNIPPGRQIVDQLPTGPATGRSL